jgi:hypothetical protein
MICVGAVPVVGGVVPVVGGVVPVVGGVVPVVGGGFGFNEDYSCMPKDVECPDGYNIADDDETSQCISNEVCEEYDDHVAIE